MKIGSEASSRAFNSGNKEAISIASRFSGDEAF
jgi:hypothetical protein